MKKLALIMAVSMMFLFAGCGASQEAAPAPEETTVATEAETTATTAAPETTQAASGEIGIDKAIDIAVKDAGLDKASVTITKQAPDIDDGRNIYEIDFTSGETEYEYDIEAATGKILERNTDSIYDD